MTFLWGYLVEEAQQPCLSICWLGNALLAFPLDQPIAGSWSLCE